jgi:hypothetical protein
MELNYDYLQEGGKYTVPEKFIGLEYLSLTPMVIEIDIKNVLCRNSHVHKHDCLAPHIRQSVL